MFGEHERRLTSSPWSGNDREKCGIVRRHGFERLRGVIVEVGCGTTDTPKGGDLKGIHAVEERALGNAGNQRSPWIGAADEGFAAVRIRKNEIPHRVANRVELGHADALEARTGGQNRLKEFTRLIQQGAAVTGSTGASLLEWALMRAVDKEEAPPLFGLGLCPGGFKG